ncbi:cytochrome P450 98A2-like [Chenopodium quinoa]|uniref:cytochrome P450 98A2-like n=1 Tax=Chenopodium quinoa TaxID=63459 RepID=UPI000B777F2B|nr:cytochrome P450 98A2-like [Chenopodium quinoa]
MCFTDSVRDERGKVRYGIATLKGIWIVDGSVTLSPEQAAKFRIRFWIFFMHSWGYWCSWPLLCWIKMLSNDLIAGGTESSTVTIEWAISELVRRPEVLAKATEELDRVVGRERWVEEKDIPNLPYIRNIVKETMRLHPVAPMLVPRMSREQVQIDGYDIPVGSVVLVNTFTIHRDPKVYESPEEFCPERFIGKNIEVKGHDFELLPFGSGRRMCPGYSLGLKIIESSVANILHGFTWKLPDSIKPEDLDMDEIFGLSNPKKLPLVACAEPRLPLHMY